MPQSQSQSQSQPLLAVCSYRAFAREMAVPGHAGPAPCVPVRTSVSAYRVWAYPWYKTGPLEHIPELAPHGIFKDPKFAGASMDVKKHAYIERLDTHSGAITAALDALTAKHPGHHLVLLCYEDVHSADPAKNVCHRTWAAEWFADRASWHVPELSPAPAAPARPAATADTLFD